MLNIGSDIQRDFRSQNTKRIENIDLHLEEHRWICVNLDLLQVSLLINKQTGGKKKGKSSVNHIQE